MGEDEGGEPTHGGGYNYNASLCVYDSHCC